MANYRHDHTHITSADPQSVIEFYQKTMGLKIIKEITLTGGKKATDVDMGGVTVRISETTGADAVLGPIYGLHHISLEVDDMASGVAELKANGADIVVEPKQTPSGTWLAFVRCPDGTLYELLQKAK
ncbi:MAG: VOC family protein [Spirochaetales bacterium]|nr:VOC family protein [Spirochaetales bacterium]